VIIHIHPAYKEYCGHLTKEDTCSTNDGHVTCIICKNNIEAQKRPVISERHRLVQDHAQAMIDTLTMEKNASKGDNWQDIPLAELWDLFEQEIEELRGALWGYMCHGKPIERVVSEGSDCSNFIAMIVDNCKKGVAKV